MNDMKQKTMFGCVFLFALLWISCAREDDDDRRSSYHVFQALHCTSIWKKNTNIVRTYRHAYGIGADSVIRYATSVWVNSYGFSWPWEPGWNHPVNVRDSFAFPLLLDANRDNVTYCFVAGDDTRDTVSISYTRHFRNYVTDAYVFTPENLRISFLSSRFLADSCMIKPRTYYSPDDKFNQTNMRLYLKP
jgi:hypothetical protein